MNPPVYQNFTRQRASNGELEKRVEILENQLAILTEQLAIYVNQNNRKHT